MLSVLYLLFFLVCGVLIARFWLPRRRAVIRWYLGAATGLLLLLWLPALWAYAVRFSVLGHALAACTLCLLVLCAYATRDKAAPVPFGKADRQHLRMLLFLALPLTLLAGYMEYTHSIRPAVDGYHVGQSTYGDLSLHLAVATSAVNAPFPLANSLRVGATMAYPYLADTFATSLYLLGMSLPMAMAFSGTVLCAMVFAGYTLLATVLCRRRGAAALAVLLLFLNGGLGFFYTLSGTVEGGVSTTLADNLHTVLTGYYQTPTNQPDYNLRWVNIICDMLIPQRGFLGGWSMLMPVFLLVLPPLAKKQRPETRAMITAGVIAGGMPLLHTHSFLALGLSSIGFCAYAVLEAPKGERLRAFQPFLWYGGVAAALAAPQLFNLTFKQAIASDHFLRFQFNWCNNRGGAGLVEPYFWFYIKNIGIPYLLIMLALFQRKQKDTSDPDDISRNDAIRQYRLLACGAFFILLIAECIIFQPNEYDNNKLIYVWFLLCLPMAADYAAALYAKLKGVGGRRVIAVLVLIACFLSAGLTIARECVSDYQAYPNEAIAAAGYIRENTPEHSVFLTGTQHLNPAASLAGRTIVNGSDLYLYFHGFNTTQRKQELEAFYENPATQLSLLTQYRVDYIYVSSYERSEYIVNEAALDRLFTRVYESASGHIVIWDAAQPAEAGAL